MQVLKILIIERNQSNKFRDFNEFCNLEYNRRNNFLSFGSVACVGWRIDCHNK